MTCACLLNRCRDYPKRSKPAAAPAPNVWIYVVTRPVDPCSAGCLNLGLQRENIMLERCEGAIFYQYGCAEAEEGRLLPRRLDSRQCGWDSVRERRAERPRERLPASQCIGMSCLTFFSSRFKFYKSPSRSRHTSWLVSSTNKTRSENICP
jgi:hypothetical protein